MRAMLVKIIITMVKIIKFLIVVVYLSYHWILFTIIIYDKKISDT